MIKPKANESKVKDMLHALERKLVDLVKHTNDTCSNHLGNHSQKMVEDTKIELEKAFERKTTMLE